MQRLRWRSPTCHTSCHIQITSEPEPLSRKTWLYPNKQNANDRNFRLIDRGANPGELGG